MKKSNKIVLIVVSVVVAVFLAPYIIVLMMSDSDDGVTKEASPELEKYLGDYDVSDVSGTSTATMADPIRPNNVFITANEDKEITLMYFNKNNFTVTEARPVIFECKDSDGNILEDNPIGMYSARANVAPSHTAGYEATVYTTEEYEKPGEYFCTILVMDNYNYGTADVRDNIEWLDIRSPENPVYEVGKILITVE